MTVQPQQENTRYRVALKTGIAGAVAAALDGDIAGVASRVRDIARSVVASTPQQQGSSSVMKPTTAGAWPLLADRGDAPVIWLRHITPTALADMPTHAEGYRDGDFVHPID